MDYAMFAVLVLLILLSHRATDRRIALFKAEIEEIRTEQVKMKTLLPDDNKSFRQVVQESVQQAIAPLIAQNKIKDERMTEMRDMLATLANKAMFLE